MGSSISGIVNMKFSAKAKFIFITYFDPPSKDPRCIYFFKIWTLFRRYFFTRDPRSLVCFSIKTLGCDGTAGSRLFRSRNKIKITEKSVKFEKGFDVI